MSNRSKSRRPRPNQILAMSAALLAAGTMILLLADSLLLEVVSATLVATSWLLPVLLYARHQGRTAGAKKTDLINAQRAIEKTVTSKVDESRTKQSRHEYHQERTLERIEGEIRRLTVASASVPISLQKSGVDVLFVTSNGAGLGHISRLLAVAKKMPSKRNVEFLTMSKAYRQAAGPGIKISYFPSSEAAGEPPATWNPVFRSFFLRLVRTRRPRVIVFDGTWVYEGITDVSRALNVPLIWIQRGMWKPEIDAASPQRHNVQSVADHVIIPGDYAGSEIVDTGKGVEPHYVDPIIMTGRGEMLSRVEACAALDLDPAEQYVLLNLGGDAIGDPSSLAQRVLNVLLESPIRLTPVQVVSPLMGTVEEIPGLIRISAYPVMRYGNAFEAIVAAAGYNSSQEAVAAGVPTLLIPNRDTKTDDQQKRASQLARQGLCLIANGEEDLHAAMHDLMNPARRLKLRSALEHVEPPRGAREAAIMIERIYQQATWTEAATTLDPVPGTDN